MGTELKGRLVDCGLDGPVQADFASDHATMRGSWKGEVAYSDAAVTVKGNVLRLSWATLHAEFDAGPLAERLAEKVRNPPTLMDKLGVTAGASVVAAHVPAEVVAAAKGVAGEVRSALAGEPVDVVLFGVQTVDNLRRMGEAWRAAGATGTLWVIYPKGKDELRESDVRSAGHMLGLVDTKTARVSATHTALRFSRRRPSAGPNE